VNRNTVRVVLFRGLILPSALSGFLAQAIYAQNPSGEQCPRPVPGSAVSEPADLRSSNGHLTVHFSFRSDVDAAGLKRYCYIAENGEESPTLRVHPGDSLIITLKNTMAEAAAAANSSTGTATSGMHHATTSTMPTMATTAKSCAGGGAMIAIATNLHFHGLAIPPVCHQDEVLTTSVLASDAPFEYRVQIPANQPPGLYWYHPHLHGFSKAQVLGGASGALIVEGIERANPALAGLAERVIVIRDQDLLNPNAPPA
jgi:FtsP/CotA-like multicopper oxidase with cupredoxin domain